MTCQFRDPSSSSKGARVRVETNRSRSIDILREQDALSLNHKEVDKLMDIANDSIERLLGHGIVLARSELGCKAVVHEGFTGSLGGNGDAEHHPRELEAPSEDVEVPNREDERHNGGIGNARGT